LIVGAEREIGKIRKVGGREREASRGWRREVTLEFTSGPVLAGDRCRSKAKPDPSYFPIS
jgi:hypothetical protein